MNQSEEFDFHGRRIARHTLGEHAYLACSTILMASGLLFTGWMSIAFHEVVFGLGEGALCIGLLMLGLVTLACGERNPIVCLIGCLLSIGPIGVIAGGALDAFDPNFVLRTGVITALFVIMTGGIGRFFPDVLQKNGKLVAWSLLSAVIVFLLETALSSWEFLMDLTYQEHTPFFDGLTIGFFMLLAGISLREANKKDRTMANATHSVWALYLTIFDVFFSTIFSFWKPKPSS